MYLQKDLFVNKIKIEAIAPYYTIPYKLVTMEHHIGKLSKMMVQTISYRDVLTLNDTRKNALKVEITKMPAPAKPISPGSLFYSGRKSKIAPPTSPQPSKFKGKIPTAKSSMSDLREFIKANNLGIITAGDDRTKENILKAVS